MWRPKSIRASTRSGTGRDGTTTVGKWLCTKVNSLLQDFSVIRGKLEAQRTFASPRSVSRERRPPSLSQGSVDTAGASPASGKAKPRRPSASGGERPTRKSPLASSSGRQPAGAASQVSKVAEASLADAMSKVPSSYEPQKKADFKHINAVYKKFWSECEDAYIFGVDAKRELSIDQLVDAPVEYNIRSSGCNGHLPPKLAGPEGPPDTVRHADEQNGEANVLGGDQGRQLLHN